MTTVHVHRPRGHLHVHDAAGARIVLGVLKYRDKGEFEESEHPRGQPGNAGEFAPRGGGAKTTTRPKHAAASPEKSAGELLKGGDLPAHILALKIPPAWTNVTYSEDPKAHLQVTGRDAKGRLQAIYHEDFKKTQAAMKFARIKELAGKFDRVQRQNEAARRSRDPRVRDSADALRLIMQTGVRPGSDADTQAAKKAYGATTLEGRHVVDAGDHGVRLKFTGKKGVDLDIPVTDPETASMLRERARRAGPVGRLFPSTSQGALLRHTHSLDGGSFKTKDFRTLLGTSEAMRAVEAAPAPRSAREYKKAVTEVARRVSRILGNTPTVALQSYISPMVFAGWRQAAGA